MFKQNLDIALWLSLIIGKVAVDRQTSSHDAFVFLDTTGALAFLVRNYDVEHLENPINVVEDINQFVSANGFAAV